MPWKETSAMDQRIQLMADWLSGDYSKTELSRIYGISRPTVDKWMRKAAQKVLRSSGERRIATLIRLLRSCGR